VVARSKGGGVKVNGGGTRMLEEEDGGSAL
jgi:hypothetical protein